MFDFNRPLQYGLDEQGNPYPTEDISVIGALFSDINKRRIALTEKDIAGHSIMASTVFLVIDHGFAWQEEEYKPVLYETMLFIDSEEVGSATRRYHTKEEASEGHEEVVNGVEQVLMQMGMQNIDTEQIIGLLTGPK